MSIVACKKLSLNSTLSTHPDLLSGRKMSAQKASNGSWAMMAPEILWHLPDGQTMEVL